MMSNALYSAWTCGVSPRAGALCLAAATQPTSLPAEGVALSSTMLTLCAMGLCVLGVWIIRCVARPNRLRLLRTPGRPNRLNIAHVIIVPLLMFLSSGLTYNALNALFVSDATTQAAEGVMKACLQIASAAVGSMVWLVAGLVVAAGTFRHGLSRGFGLSLRHWIYDLGRAIVAYLAVLPVCIGLALLFAYIFKATDLTTKVHPVLTYMTDFSPPWRMLAILQAVILAPLAEEVFFRGVLQSFFRQQLGSPRIAILLASAVFAAVHINQPQAIPSLLALSLALGYNYERTGRLTSPILIHAIFNAVNVAVWRG